MNLTRTGCAFLMLLSFAKPIDRKSTRLNSSHLVISYAVFCLKKKNKHARRTPVGAPPCARAPRPRRFDVGSPRRAPTELRRSLRARSHRYPPDADSREACLTA